MLLKNEDKEQSCLAATQKAKDDWDKNSKDKPLCDKCKSAHNCPLKFCDKFICYPCMVRSQDWTGCPTCQPGTSSASCRHVNLMFHYGMGELVKMTLLRLKAIEKLAATQGIRFAV